MCLLSTEMCSQFLSSILRCIESDLGLIVIVKQGVDGLVVRKSIVKMGNTRSLKTFLELMVGLATFLMSTPCGKVIW